MESSNDKESGLSRQLVLAVTPPPEGPPMTSDGAHTEIDMTRVHARTMAVVANTPAETARTPDVARRNTRAEALDSARQLATHAAPPPSSPTLRDAFVRAELATSAEAARLGADLNPIIRALCDLDDARLAIALPHVRHLIDTELAFAGPLNSVVASGWLKNDLWKVVQATRTAAWRAMNAEDRCYAQSRQQLVTVVERMGKLAQPDQLHDAVRTVLVDIFSMETTGIAPEMAELAELASSTSFGALTTETQFIVLRTLAPALEASSDRQRLAHGLPFVRRLLAHHTFAAAAADHQSLLLRVACDEDAQRLLDDSAFWLLPHGDQERLCAFALSAPRTNPRDGIGALLDATTYRTSDRAARVSALQQWIAQRHARIVGSPLFAALEPRERDAVLRLAKSTAFLAQEIMPRLWTALETPGVPTPSARDEFLKAMNGIRTSSDFETFSLTLRFLPVQLYRPSKPYALSPYVPHPEWPTHLQATLTIASDATLAIPCNVKARDRQWISVELVASLAALTNKALASLRSVTLEPGRGGMAGSFSITIGAEREDGYRRASRTRALVFHEMGHVLEGVTGLGGFVDVGALRTAWNEARTSDVLIPSFYGDRYLRPTMSEDFAESCALYYSVRGTVHEAQFRALLPARFAILDRVEELQPNK